MKTAARMFSIVALVVLLLAANGAWADSHVRIVRLSYLQGDVSLDLGQGAGSQRAVLNMPIVEGTRLWTGADGQAEVEFEDGSTVRITPNAGLEFTALGLRDSGARVNTIAVVGGTAYVDVPRLAKEDEFTFRLPNRAITLTHSVHFRIDMDGMEARLAVFKGELDVAGSQRSVDIHKGETLTLSLNDAERYNLANNVASLVYDAWDQDRDDTIREAGLSRNSQLYPYGYGYADLMNYGSFMNVGGYGSCWRPYGVGFDWDPFDYGYWSYYPGFGYTWVSGYPWGWAPYRYGGWAWSNAGWSWCPRYNNVANLYAWNVVPVVISSPPRWHAPHPPDKPSVGLPPIIPVGRRGPAPYRGGLISDKPGSGSTPNAETPANPDDRRSGRRAPGIDASHLTGSGTPPGSGMPTGGGPVVIVAPSAVSPSGGEERGRGPRPNRGIDLTPPGSPAGRGANHGAPIQSPVPIMRSPGHIPDAPSGGRPSRIEASGGGSPRMDASHVSAPSSSPRMDSSHMAAPVPHMDSPRMSAPASPAPSSGGGGGERGGARGKPPVQ